MSLTVGQQIDRTMAAAWPALQTSTIGGWEIRATEGLTRRANSALAWPLDGSVDLEHVVVAVERFYDDRGLRPVFSVSDASAPAELQPLLVARGYEVDAETLVLDIALDAARARTETERAAAIALRTAANDAWIDVYTSSAPTRWHKPEEVDRLRATLLQPSLPTRFATVGPPRGAHVEAIGQVVVDGDWACLQCMATRPEAQGQGHAGRVVTALLGAASDLGASKACLAVLASNEAARRVYERAGFTPSHQYRYLAR